MQTITVLKGFSEYEKGELVRREKGAELTVPNERSDQLRERGLARAKPSTRKRDEEVTGDGSGHALPPIADKERVDDPGNPGTAS